MRIFVKSFGCSTNLADGAVLSGCLAEAGFKLADSVKSADVVVYNTCAVKGPTEDRIVEALKRVPKSKKLIVAGCLPVINFERLRREVRFDGVVGPAFGERIVDVVDRVLKGEKCIVLEDCLESKPSFSLPRVQLSPVISIVPVNYGCLGSCAYCCVVFARGRLRSYGIEEIAERMRREVKRGLKEFWITSQDTAAYGRDIGTDLAELLQALCSLKGDFKIRVGMMTPNLAMDILPRLIQALENEHVFKFVHLPIQSGNNTVLKNMRRFYCVDDFRKIVTAFRDNFPKLTLSTDVICGFPGETEEAFEETLELIKEARPDIVNVSKFFARPKTLAAKMQKDFVPLGEIKRRSRLAALSAKKIAFEQNKHWEGWLGTVLVDEVGKVSGSWIGRNFAYKPTVVKSSENLLGKKVQVRISKAFSSYLQGEFVE
jgi:MiaB-like tRNA modifying enzyme